MKGKKFLTGKVEKRGKAGSRLRETPGQSAKKEYTGAEADRKLKNAVDKSGEGQYNN